MHGVDGAVDRPESVVHSGDESQSSLLAFLAIDYGLLTVDCFDQIRLREPIMSIWSKH